MDALLPPSLFVNYPLSQVLVAFGDSLTPFPQETGLYPFRVLHCPVPQACFLTKYNLTKYKDKDLNMLTILPLLPGVKPDHTSRY